MKQNERLISLDKVLSDLQELAEAASKDSSEKYMPLVAICFDTMRKHFESFPIVDAEKVVRCKNCKHWEVREINGKKFWANV